VIIIVISDQHWSLFASELLTHKSSIR